GTTTVHTLTITNDDAIPDTTAPAGSISINSNASYTNSANVSLSLSATDTTGVTGYYLSTSNITPSASATGWTALTSTTNYSASVSHTLDTGDGTKTLYCWYKDSAGNVSSSSTDSVTLDSTAPTVTISSPTTSATYSTTISTLNLSGSASDATSGLAAITYTLNSAAPVNASGLTTWSIANLALQAGTNTIIATATDNAGNSSTDTLTVTYTIPTPGTITLSGATYSVVENTPTVTINVTRTGGSSGAASVQYSTSDGTAASGSDYTSASGTLNWIDADSANKTFTITITNDTTDEADETVNITLSNATGASLGTPSSAVLTITDDDPAPTVAFTSATQSKAENAGSATITAQLSAASAKAISIPFTVSGTATGGGTDYSITTSPLNIPASSTSAEITLTLTNDSTYESQDEAVIVTLSTPTNAT
ncbi:MAG: Calx-beta domain-containing protein, partial [Candidatus Omnitrophota bacterium]